MTATLEFYPAVRLCVLMGANPEKLSPHIETASDRVWRLYLVACSRQRLILAYGGDCCGNCGCSWKRPTFFSEKIVEARIV
jgi:hypothetical protein